MHSQINCMSSKFAEISMIRLIATLFIVVCHILQFYGNELAWWFNVGVHIFFVLSGFLYGSKNIGDTIGFYLRRVRKIMVPYYIYVMCAIVVISILAPDTLSWGGVICLLTFSGKIPGLDHLWFIPYILFCYLITPLLERIKNRLVGKNIYRQLFIVLTIIFVFIVEGTMLGIHFEPHYVICYVTGYFLSAMFEHNDNNDTKLCVSIYSIIIVAAVLMNSVRIYIKYFSTTPIPSVAEKYRLIFNSYSHAMLGISLFLVMRLCFKKMRNMEIKLLRITDKYCFYVYLTHHVLILGPLSLLSIFSKPVGILAVIGVTGVCSIILMKFDLLINKLIDSAKR